MPSHEAELVRVLAVGEEQWLFQQGAGGLAEIGGVLPVEHFGQWRGHRPLPPWIGPSPSVRSTISMR